MADWDGRMLGLARYVAGWSKDPRTQVGCVIADAGHRIVSLGFNGYPAGMLDTIATDAHDVKHSRVMHAELNALLFAGRPMPEGSTLYCTHPLCDRCMVAVLQAGIRRVVAETDGRVRSVEWHQQIHRAQTYAQELNITYHLRTGV